MKYRVLIPLAMIPLLAFAQSFEDGWEAYENARFGDALSILEPLADAGDASSQFALARMYETGRGVEASQVEAARWYRLAANGGHRLAQFVMGLKYSTGRGVEPNAATAAQWYLRSARQGYANAQLNIGAMYALGDGVAQDKIRAFAWWNLAAAQGNTIAARNRDALASELTEAQVAKAKALADELGTR